MNIKKRILPMILAIIMLFSVMSAISLTASASDPVQLQLGKIVSANQEPERGYLDYLINDDTSWFDCNFSLPAEITIDLGHECEITEFSLENANNLNLIIAYKIYATNDQENWGDPVINETDSTVKYPDYRTDGSGEYHIYKDELEDSVFARYVKIVVTNASWNSLRIQKIRVIGFAGTDPIYASEIVNIVGISDNVWFGEKGTVSAVVKPTSADVKECIYTSSNPDVIYIDENTGDWEAKELGTAKITAALASDDTISMTTETIIVVKQYPLLTKNTGAYAFGSSFWEGGNTAQVLNPDSLDQNAGFAYFWMQCIFVDLGEECDISRISIVYPNDPFHSKIGVYGLADEELENRFEQPSDDEDIRWEERAWYLNNYNFETLVINMPVENYSIVKEGTQEGYKVDANISKSAKYRYLMFVPNEGEGFNICNIQVYGELPVTGIEVETLPTQTTYKRGEDFNYTDMVVKALYSDGSDMLVSKNEYTVQFDSSVLGEQDVIVTYNKKTTSFKVTIEERELVDISAVIAPGTVFYVGDSLNETILKVFANYDSGKSEEVEYTTDITKFTEAGTDIKITVTALGKIVEIFVDVFEIELTGIEITSLPKVVYIEGELFNAEGLVVSKVYNNGDRKETEDYTIDKTEELTIEDTVVIVTLTSTEFTAEIEIIVNEEALESITVELINNEAVYYVGDSFNLADVEITAVFNNGRTEIIDNNDENLSVTPATFTQAGEEIEVTITYEGKSEKVIIEVLEVVINDKINGDVNGDGSVTITDAIAIFRHLADKVKITDEDAKWAADVDGNGKIEILDAINIFRYLADKMTIEQLQDLHFTENVNGL